jgi:hypothetical protein
MAKNTTRKGLAFGATLALSASALVGFAAPAQASTLVVIPNGGTSTSFISGESFSVKLLGALSSSDAAALRWEISGIDTGETVTVTGGTATGTTTKTVTPTSGSTTAGGNTLGVALGAAETGSVLVRAYIESGDAAGFSATYDTSYSTPMTVNFIEAKDLVSTLVLTTPTEGDTTASAKFSLNVNNEQLTAGDFAVHFTDGVGAALAGGVFDDGTGTLPAITGSEVVKAPAAWDATNGFVATTGTLTALVKDTAVKATLVYNDGGVEDTDGAHPLAATGNVVVGTASSALVVARRAATIVASTVASATANTSNAVLLNGAWKVKALVKDGATTPAAVAGIAVSATVTTNATLASTTGAVVSLTVNGTTHTSTATLPGAGSVAKLALTTDANGEVFVDLATAGYTNGQTVTVSFVVENLAAATVTNTAATATYTVRQNKAVSAVVDGATAPVTVSVLDQFGGVIAAGYKAYATLASSTQATTAATTAASGGAADVVNGSATLNLYENGTGAGINTYTISVAKVNGDGSYATALGSTVSHAVNIVAAADLVAGEVASTTGTKNATTGIYEVAGTNALVLQANAAYDANTVVDTAPSAFSTAFAAGDIAIGGTIKTASSATVAAKAIPGAAVTISGAGLQFSDGSGVYKADSITVYANASGVFAAAVSSNKAGKQTITVTSGSASATITATFAAAAEETGTVLTIDAPANVLPGSTWQATAKLVDKYGNVVDTDQGVGGTTPTFSFSAVSPGIQVGSNPTATDADGLAKLAYFLGNNDTGSIVVTATYDADGNTATTTDKISATATIVIGSAAVSSWTKKLDDSSAKIYAKNIVGAGKVQFFLNGKEIAWVNASSAADSKLRTANGASYLVRTVEFAAGKNVLEVYVDGVRTTRTSYTK